MKNFGEFLRKDVALGPFKCKEPGCWESYMKPSDLVAHKRSHHEEGGYVCKFPGCEMYFTDCDSLSRHKNIHTGDKPQEFDVSKSFSRSGHLKKDQKIHSREVSFIEGRNAKM
jgi:uncharacterized Zn-finger protein